MYSTFVLLLLTFSNIMTCMAVTPSTETTGKKSACQYIFSTDTRITSAISDKLIGFNLIYPHEKDYIWKDGKLAGYLEDMQVAFLRYPGGTVCSYYHWNALTGEGWKDSWDPDRPVTPKAPSEFMEIDEYIALVRKTGATPLVGINMSSGWRWNRQDEGLKEALALMQYCKDQNFHVEYWYLDNEPYMHDSNGGSKTPEQYAALINAYVPVMKAFDPNVKIVANWNSGFKNKRSEFEALIKLAGKNIDIMDVHWYWSWNDASWKRWLEKTPMVQWTGFTYDQDIEYFREMKKELGYPNMKLASFEWNTGSPKEDITPARMALIQIEMMMQFIRGGLDMAIMWPIHWPDVNAKKRSLYNEQTSEINPVYHLFKFFGNMQGGKYFHTQLIKPNDNMVSFAVQDASSKIYRFCVLNKNSEDVMTEIKLDKLPGMKIKEAMVYSVSDNGSDYSLDKVDKLSQDNSGAIRFLSKRISLTMLTFEKK